MRDFACQKNKKTSFSVSKSKAKKKSDSSFLNSLSCFFLAIYKVLKNFIALLILFVLLLGALYLFSDSLLEYFYPLKEAKNLLLVLDQSEVPQTDSKFSSCYFLSVKPSTKTYFLATLPDTDCNQAGLNTVSKRSAQLGVLIDQVLVYQLTDETDLKTLSTKQLNQVLRKLMIQEVKQRHNFSTMWQNLIKLMQLRQVLLDYQFQGKNFSQGLSSIDELASFVLAEDSDCAIGVLNTTSIPGLATKVANILEQSGLLILRISNSDQKDYRDLEQSVLLIKEETASCQVIIERLKNWRQSEFSLEVKEDQQLTNRYRSNLILLIGEDFK